MKRCTVNANIVLSLSIGLAFALGLVVINSQAAPLVHPQLESAAPVTNPTDNTSAASLNVAPSRLMASGGPDMFGYIFKDSSELGGPLYAWQEISSTGTQVTGWTSFDAGYAGPIPIGFDVDYYGANYDQLYVSTNGYLSFGQGYGNSPGGPLPQTGDPNNDIALFGGDMYLYNYGGDSIVYYQTFTNPNRLVIEFVNLYYCCGQNTPHTFEAILFSNGDILAQYRSLNGTSAGYVGIENATGTDGLWYSATLSDSLAIRYYYPRGVYLAPPYQTGSGVPGSTVTHTIWLTNQTGTADSFTVTAQPGNVWTTTLYLTQTDTLSNGVSLSFTVSVTIPAGTAWYVTDVVTITATSVASPTVYSDTATITTQAYAPPQISVSPDVLTSTQYVNEIVTRPMTISNGNGVPLTFNLATSMPSNGLVAYYPFNGNAHDESGNGNDGTIMGATWTTGQVGGALSFDGLDDYVTVSDFPYVLQNFTVEAWVKSVGDPGGKPYDSFIMLGTIPYHSWAFAYNRQENRWDLWDRSGSSWYVPSLSSRDSWKHIVIVYTANKESVYENGTLLAEQTLSLPIPAGGDQTLYIGAAPQDSQYLNGFIDEVAIYNRALSEAEIREPPWLSKDPISGTVATNSSTPVQITFNAASMQPGIYTTDIVVRSNDPVTPSVSVPVTMTVLPTADLGRVTGAVSDAWTGLPLTATVELVGVYSMTARPNYTIWATAGTYSLTAYAAGYYTVTRSVTINAGGLVTVNLALEPAQPQLGWMPTTISTTAVAGSKVNWTWMISNAGPLPLTIAVYEISPTTALQAMSALPADLTGKRILYDRAHGEPALSDYGTLASDVISAGAVITENWYMPIDVTVLRGYDVLWANCCGGTSWGFGELTAVQDWLNQGGAVFVQGESSNSTVGLASIFGINYQSGNCTSGTTTDIRDHPIREGVSTVNVDWTCWRLSPGSGATIVVFDPQGQPHVVAQEQNGGKMVVVSSKDFSNGYIYNNDNRRLANNILSWLARPGYGDVPWLSETPVTGTIPGHSSLPVTLRFDATTLSVGEYRATLALEHNASSRPSPVEVPVIFAVITSYKVYLPIVLKGQ